MLFYIGTQISQGQGIFAARLDDVTGHLTSLGAVAEVERPTWVLADPNRPVLYAVSEVGNAGDRIAEVSSFSMQEADASLTPLSRTSSRGGGATHLALHPGGRRLFVANYGGGQVTTLAVTETGILGDALSVQTTYGSGPLRRQTGPHAHGVTLDPSGRFVLVPDMGADRIFVYRYEDGRGELSPAEVPYTQLPAGSGPRLLHFGADGRFAYMLTELSSEIYVFRWDGESGRLDEVGSHGLDEETPVENRTAAAFTLSPDGRFVYASNRRTSNLHVYAVDAATGVLRAVQTIDSGGMRPWSAEFCPGGRWMVVTNQASNNVCVFAVDPDTGRLSPVAGGIEVPLPTGTSFVP